MAVVVAHVACARPAGAWSQARGAVHGHAGVCVVTAYSATRSSLLLDAGGAAAVRGLGVAPGRALAGLGVAAPRGRDEYGATSAVQVVLGVGPGRALAGLGVAAPRGRDEYGATSAVQVVLGVAGLGACHLDGAPLAPPARLLSVACAAGASAPGLLGDDGEPYKVSWYKKSVEMFEDGFRAAALFEDKELVNKFMLTAERAVQLVDKTMTTNPEDVETFSLEMIDIIDASKSLRRVVLQAKAGYVLAASVVEANNGISRIMEVLNPGRPVPLYPSVVPYVVHECESLRYFTDLYEGFTDLVVAAEDKFTH